MESLIAERAPLDSCSSPNAHPAQITTPALVYDQSRLNSLAALAKRVACCTDTCILYAVKACSFVDVLHILASSLHGFAVSSLFEARMIRDLIPDCTLHFTTPGLRNDEIEEVADLCTHITFNSESQLHRFGPRVCHSASVGLRVNTEISYVKDSRYDPARRRSKLGVPLNRLTEILSSSPLTIRGLHFHTNADSDNLLELEATVAAISQSIPPTVRFDWINLGGGYLFDQVSDFTPLNRAVGVAIREIASEVFLEPGAALVRTSGKLISTIVDLFDRHSTRIAVLDTSVNHMPEVLEFGYQPDVEGASTTGVHEYVLAGASCLAGDTFGRYHFDAPLSVADTITFVDVGAYAQAKSHRFNGINLPSVWIRSTEGILMERQSLDYADYLIHWKANV